MRPMTRLSILVAGIFVTVALATLASGAGSPMPRLASETVLAGGNITLSPPPASYEPRIASDVAVAVASDMVGAVDSSVGEPALALFSASAVPVDPDGTATGPPIFQKMPAWIVQVQGPCLETMPGIGCLTNLSVAIDSETGKPLLRWAEDKLPTLET